MALLIGSAVYTLIPNAFARVLICCSGVELIEGATYSCGRGARGSGRRLIGTVARGRVL